MASALPVLKPADVIIIKGSSFFSRLIEYGEHLDHLPEYSHGALFSHYDANNVGWCIEGRPGGVGWAQADPYLRMEGTLTNIAQPKTALQRARLVDDAKAMLGTAYDWEGIVQDGLRDTTPEGLKLDELWQSVSGQAWNPPGISPAHVVCTSFLAWDYDREGLAAPLPSDPRNVEPGDWAQFILLQSWLAPPPKKS